MIVVGVLHKCTYPSSRLQASTFADDCCSLDISNVQAKRELDRVLYPRIVLRRQSCNPTARVKAGCDIAKTCKMICILYSEKKNVRITIVISEILFSFYLHNKNSPHSDLGRDSCCVANLCTILTAQLCYCRIYVSVHPN